MTDLSPAKPVVWIVDDSPLDLERARRALSGAHELRLFADGSAALESLDSASPPDVLVLDWVMPGISGVEVCRFLRAQANLPQVGVLLLTSQQETAQIVEGLAAGANDYLCKPYSDEEMAARVTSLLRSRRLLERAEEAEKAVRGLLDHAPDALIGVGTQRRVTYVNAEAARMLGGSPQQLQGTPLRDLLPDLPLEGLHASDEPRALSDLVRGDRVYAPIVRYPAKAIDKNIDLIVSLRDVTSARRAEARRLDFYSVVAHDLRTPLNAMALRVHMMTSGRRGVVPTEVLTDLRRIDANVRSLVTMVNDFLELARLEASPEQVRRDSIDMGSLVEEAIDELRPLADANGQTIAWTGAPPGALVVGDQRRLHQVVSNLVGNAIKFTPPSGKVTATVRLEGGLVEVRIEDNGPGISAEALPTIFDRFSRAPQTQGVAGSGLGLMIARQIVEAHGGTIGVVSRPGEGSSFWFRLPRAAQLT